MPQTQIVEISEDGEVRITVKGIKGKSCKDATRQIEQALGRVTQDTPTPEMHEEVKAHAKH